MQIVTLAIHSILCFLFVSVFDGRETGAAIATNITYILNMVALEVYCNFSETVKHTYQFLPDRRTVQNVGSYMAISLPSALMICFEWWAWEILALFAGLISVEALAAQVIGVNFIALIFEVPLGASYAASAFTGYFLGKKKIAQAKKYARLTVLFNMIVTVLIIIILLAFHKQFSVLFTQDPKTVEFVSDILYFMCPFVFFDTLHGVQTGVIRGLGKQVICSIWTLVCMYLIGLPLSLLFTFWLDKGVIGLWYGFTIAEIVMDIGYMMICECPDWDKIAQEMQARIDKENTRKETSLEHTGASYNEEDQALRYQTKGRSATEK